MEGIVSVVTNFDSDEELFILFFDVVSVVDHQGAVTHRFATRVLNINQAVST